MKCAALLSGRSGGYCVHIFLQDRQVGIVFLCRSTVMRVMQRLIVILHCFGLRLGIPFFEGNAFLDERFPVVGSVSIPFHRPFSLCPKRLWSISPSVGVVLPDMPHVVNKMPPAFRCGFP